MKAITMKKSELKQIIKEEIQNLNEVSDSFKVRNLIDTIHNEIRRLKRDKNIDKKLTKNLFTDFDPLFKSLDNIATFLANKWQ